MGRRAPGARPLCFFYVWSSHGSLLNRPAAQHRQHTRSSQSCLKQHAAGVAAGAFGAHALQASVSPERIAVWDTAAQYHLIHAAVILALALGSQTGDSRWRLPMMGFTAGVLLFSFSLYALVLTDMTLLAMITPVGGLLLIMSWLIVAIKALK